MTSVWLRERVENAEAAEHAPGIPGTHSTASADRTVSRPMPRSRGLLDDLWLLSDFVELGRERLTDALAKNVFDELACLTAFAARETLGLDFGLSRGRHDDLDEFGVHAAPPT